MTVQRYSSNKDRTMQTGSTSCGQTINRRCDEPRCAKPMARGQMWRGLRYCAQCYEAKAGKKVAA